MDSIADIPNILAHSSLAMLAFVIRDLLIHNFCVPLFITINYKLEQEFLSVQYLSLLVSDFLLSFSMNSFAQTLISTRALRVDVAAPFKWTSGILAPIYVDCRVVIGFPDQRRRLVDGLVALIQKNIGAENFDVIVGGVTAGIPMASILAERLNKPLAYVRKEPKAHGKGQQVEGADVAGKRVLLFDELISRGSSVTAFCPALRAAGATLTDLLVMLSYDSTEVRAAAKDCNVKLHALLTLDEVLAATELSDGDRAEVARFRENPPNWRP